MTPTITFYNFQELYDYIYEFIITNHNNEIIAVQHNNIESGLLDFTVQAPRNSFKATIRTTAGTYTATINECVLVFKPAATGTITLTDNRWNEWVIVNLTSSNKQLIGAIANYVTSANTVRNYIPALTSVSIAKGLDGIWYESSTTSGSSPSSNATSSRIQFEVGVPNSYISNTIDESDVELPADTETALVINVANVIDDSAELFSDGELKPRDLTGQESYGVVYEADKITFNYFPEFRQDQVIVVRFQYTS